MLLRHHRQQIAARRSSSRGLGELILAAASPEGFTPVARAQILPGVVRAYPAIAGGLLYVRNEKTLVCLDLRK